MDDSDPELEDLARRVDHLYEHALHAYWTARRRVFDRYPPGALPCESELSAPERAALRQLRDAEADLAEARERLHGNARHEDGARRAR